MWLHDGKAGPGLNYFSILFYCSAEDLQGLVMLALLS